MPVAFGRYQLNTRIASGGMGEVFLARRGDETLVVKRLLPHLTADAMARARFVDEARIASAVRHPNLVKILELGQVDGQWFIAMEYVAGTSLHELMALGPLEVNEALRIAADVAGALAAVHAARDVRGQALHALHGDVTPRNVLIRSDGVVKVIDFGVSGVRGGGTLEYRAPEGDDDQFSLGVILWELLSGRWLFHGESDAQTVALTDAAVVPKLSQVDREVEQVVRRMLARDPAERFASCDEVRLTLLELLESPTAPLVGSSVAKRLERPVSSFIGRAAELRELQALVAAGATAITITGRSGVGKSRVALELNERVGPKVDVTAALEPMGQPSEVVYLLPLLSEADAQALYLARSGGGSSSARALDGLALTVELLAARGSSQSHDLRGAFDATWSLLKRAERLLLSELAHVSGSVTLERAEQLHPDALELLETLRDAALIQVVEAGDGELRFALHDAIRALIRLAG